MNKRPSPPEDARLPLNASMLDGLSDPVILLDRERRVVSHNLTARQLLGADATGPALERFLNNPQNSVALTAVRQGGARQRAEVVLPSPMARTYELTVWELPAERFGRSWSSTMRPRPRTPSACGRTSSPTSATSYARRCRRS